MHMKKHIEIPHPFSYARREAKTLATLAHGS